MSNFSFKYIGFSQKNLANCSILVNSFYFLLKSLEYRSILCWFLFIFLNFVLFNFWPHHIACGILVPRQIMEPEPCALEVRVLTTELPGEVRMVNSILDLTFQYHKHFQVQTLNYLMSSYISQGYLGLVELQARRDLFVYVIYIVCICYHKYLF